MTTMMFVPSALCVTALAVVTVLKNRIERWASLPHFIHNYIAGRFAICSITDFNKAPLEEFPSDSGEVKRFRRVSETLVFGNSQLPMSAQCFSGKMGFDGPARLVTDNFYPRRDSFQLFVPFTSEKYMSFADQQSIFTAPQDPGQFAERKKKENCAADFRLRFVVLARWWDWADWQMWLTLASLLTILCASFVVLIIGNRQADVRVITVHVTTTDGKVHEIVTTGKDELRLLMDETSSENWIIKGHVRSIQEVGGNISRICAEWGTNKMRCGMASKSLGIQEGDEVYLRDAEFQWWSDDIEIPENHRTSDTVVVNKAEAEGLVATGKFRLIE